MDDSWEERLLGFDARVSAPSYWSPRRKGEYLLRTDVTQPFSADPDVWPSLFDRPGTARPSCVGFFQDLWEDAQALVGHLATHAPAVDCVVVAVTVLARRLEQAGPSPLAPVLSGRVYDAFTGLALPLPFARPPERDPRWSLLGYDIADIYGLSGLSNCGYRDLQALQQEALRQRFAPRLNERHLFAAPEVADELRPICDGRVADHRPFFVYGLWQVG